MQTSHVNVDLVNGTLNEPFGLSVLLNRRDSLVLLEMCERSTRPAGDRIQSVHFIMPLMISWARSGSLEAVRLLVDEGANIYAADGFGWTALMVAAADGQLEILKYLQELGCDVMVRDKEGISAFMWACANNHYETAAYLLEQGAELNQEDLRGRTALDFATRTGSQELRHLLASKGAKHGSSSGDTEYAVRPIPVSPQAAQPIVSLDGDLLELEQFRGRATLLVFYASWCQPCVDAETFLTSLAGELGHEHFAMVAINGDDRVEKARDLTGSPWPTNIYYDAHGISSERLFGVDRYPTFVLLDHTGKTITVNKGWSEAVSTILQRETRKAARKARKNTNARR